MRTIFPMFLIAFFLRPALGAPPKLFKYTIASVPFSEAQCEKEAKALGEKLVTETGTRLFSASCQKAEFGRTTDIVLSYAATEPLPLVSNSLEQPLSPQGAYASLADCQTALPDQIRLFLQETGLRNTFISYCYREHLGDSKSFVYRIDAFGHPKKSPFVYVSSLLAVPTSVPSLLEGGIRRSLEGTGVTVADVTLGTTNTTHRLHISYFAAKKLLLETGDALFFASAAACDSQIASLERTLKLGPSRTHGVWCGSEPSLQRYEILYLLSSTTHRSKGEKTPERFSSAADCEAKRDAAVEFYKSVLKKEAFGALCFDGRPNYGHRMQVFYSVPVSQ